MKTAVIGAYRSCPTRVSTPEPCWCGVPGVDSKHIGLKFFRIFSILRSFMQSDTACFQAALEAKRAELLAHAHKLEAIRIEQAADQLDHLQLLQDRELVVHQL